MGSSVISPGRKNPSVARPSIQAKLVEELAHEHETTTVGEVRRAVTDAQRPAGT